MSYEVIEKKLDQIKELLGELDGLLEKSLDEFIKDKTVVRASERNYQLIIDLASDINTQILIEIGRKTPDTYKQSFSDLGKAGVLNSGLVNKMVQCAKLRNILVHEYDFEEDYEKFYSSAKENVGTIKEYARAVNDYI